MPFGEARGGGRFDEAGDTADEDNEQDDTGSFDPADYISDLEGESEDEGEDASGHADGTFGSDAKLKRKAQRKAANNRARERAKSSLQSEQSASMRWKPKPVCAVQPVAHMMLSSRWKCEQFIRAYTAHLGCQHSVSIHQTVVKCTMTCRTKGCGGRLVFDRQPKSGMWKLNVISAHMEYCYGEPITTPPSARKPKMCAPAYTAQQVSRLLRSEAAHDPNITSRMISELVKAKNVYRRQPPLSHFRAIKLELNRHVSICRHVDMAALDGYASLLRDVGHKVEIDIIKGIEMKAVRVTSSRHIFNQMKKAGSIDSAATFDKNDVDVSDIIDDWSYYSGFLFVPNVAETFCQHALTTCAADAAHCEGIGTQSYGTTFEVVTYDSNHHLCPLLFAHSIGSECTLSWKRVFNALAEIPHFDIPGRTTIVDQEKSIDSAYASAMKHADYFLDPLHVRKNMLRAVGAEKSDAVWLYTKALYAPTKQETDSFIARFGPRQRAYLDKFDKKHLYRSYSSLKDLITTSQGAESQMSAALRNHIRSVEPQQMLKKVFHTYREGCLSRATAALNCKSPVPPHVERHLASLISKSRVYQGSVQFIAGTGQMEATVRSETDASVERHVVLSDSPQTVPSCCAYSKLGTGYPCFHGVAIIAERFGSTNLYRFVDEKHLSSTWSKQYEEVSFNSPSQHDVDSVMMHAKRLVATGANLNVPKAIPPPRGRPVKNAGKRRKGWYEKGPGRNKKRSYCCSLCNVEGHTKDKCQLRQLFDD